MVAFSLAAGGACTVYMANVINENKTVKLYQPGVPQVEQGNLEEGKTIYYCIFTFDCDKMLQCYQADKEANNRSYFLTETIYRMEHVSDPNVYSYLFNAGGNMQFRIAVSNQSYMCGNGGDTCFWSYYKNGGTSGLTGIEEVELKDGYRVPAHCGDSYYEFQNTAFRVTYVRPGFEGCVTIDNLPFKL